MEIEAIFIDSERKSFFVQMPFCPGGNLDDFIKVSAADGTMSGSDVRLLLQRALQGVEYLHARGIVHADLKPANILVDGGGMPRLTDFETSRPVNVGACTSSLSKGGGSLGFVAPELHDGKTQPTRSSDMFAFGKTLDAAREAMAVLPGGAGALEDLIAQLATENAGARPTASQALQHRYFTTDAAAAEEKVRSAAEAQAEKARIKREELDASLQAVHDQKHKLQRQAAEHKRLCAETQQNQREAVAEAQRQKRALQASKQLNEREARELQAKQEGLEAQQREVRDTQAAEEQQLQQKRYALAQKELELKRHLLTAGQYEWLDEHGSWNQYPQDVNAKIIAAAKSAAMCSFERGHHEYSVTTRFPMFQTNVRYKTNRHVRLAGGPADEQYLRETPRYWRPGTTPTVYEIVELDCSNPDMKVAFDDVVALVTRECDIDVLSVSVLQAPARWKAYNHKKAHLEAKLAGGANERRVFHGGAEASIQSIARQGFIREYNHTSVYGKGTYFARDMSYSAEDRYTPPNANDEKFAFLARVLVGEPCVGSSGMAMPTAKPDGSLHDSMVDRLVDPSVFVLSSGSDEHTYPEFMVRFKRN
jgi:poly [ADP-ribose] polymerase 10/14/15